MITKINGYTRWIQGSAPLPAGAVPLAADNFGPLICLMPSGRWIMWVGGALSSLPDSTQRDVMEIVIEQLGGTAQSAADQLGVSRRTVEAWRSGAAKLPCSQAFRIAEKLSAAEAENDKQHRTSASDE